MSTPTLETESQSPNENYNLTREEADRLTADLLESRPPEGDDRFVCYMLHGSDRYANIGRHVESVVFNDAFGNDPDEMLREYGPYEQQSTFFVSIDREKKTATGALRIIENGRAGLKTLNDLEEMNPELSVENVKQYYDIDNLDDCWDIGTVAVMPENRSAEGGVSIQLYRGMYVAAMEANVQHVVSIIDSKPLAKLTKYLGIPFKPLVESKPFEYLGSESSQAVYGHVPEFYDRMNRGRWLSIRRIMARNVLRRLIKGTQDSELQFGSRYKK